MIKAEVHPATPVCPGCGAKHSRDRVTLKCKKCGLPDEVLARGSKAVERWRRAQGYKPRFSASSGRKRRPHGRARGGSKRRVKA